MNDGIAFEKMCETLFRKRGYLIKKRGSRSYDGGIDIIMKHENGDDIIGVQCKKTMKPVGRPDVQKLGIFAQPPEKVY
jgi:restriction endonuclease Mrr